ncbi:arabinosyltransferase domain-containing protein [Tomitella gaofuii]|uniref:arabinosyltransferase domain-containing protein n=1 Tax=Tomitella gaofuii TaxID=2760083 RepID=UPI0015FE2F8A|nr:arabinosyltransferase domain-containing protein [Tomitella gaofuii]
MPTTDPGAAAQPAPSPRHRGRSAVGARAIAVVAGLVGLLLALAVPFLPVTQTTAHLSWPQGGTVAPVTAPLVTYAPTDLRVTVPCSAVADLAAHPSDAPGGGRTVLSTAPAGSLGAAQRALLITTGYGEVTVRSAGEVLASVPLASAAGGGCDTITVTATAAETTVRFAGPDGAAPAAMVTDHDARPQVVGVFTDLTGPAPDGLSVEATVDTRYIVSPTLLKWLAMGLAVALTAVSLAALARVDAAAWGGGRARWRALRWRGVRGPPGLRRTGRRVRLFPRRWRRIGAADVTVVAVLLIWHIIGANTSDDGYELAMARAAEHAGYMPNYFRWFGAPEAPFGYPYYVFTLLDQISPASVVLRLPALAAALLSWLLISRELIPRFGRAARHDTAALWTAALVLLAFWLPYNNGLRPEPYIAAGILVTWVCVERAVATGRLMPAGLGLAVAVLTLTGGPTGTICAAPFLAAGRPLLRLIRSRGRRFGYAPTLAPLAAAASVVLVVAFSRASMGPLVMATRMKPVVGPSEPWYLEYQRYIHLLLQGGPDGSIARRFAVLVMLLCLVVCAVLLVRRRAGLVGRAGKAAQAGGSPRGRIVGLAAGPALRAVVVVALGIALMTFNPTKWTHHFGVFAGVAAVLAALTVVALRGALRETGRPRSCARTLFSAGVLLILAVTFTSTNSWWYVSNYGVPNGLWVTIAGWVLALVCFVNAVVRLVRVWRWRDGPAPEKSAAHDRPAGRIPRLVPAGLRRRLEALPSYAPLPIAAAGVVAFTVVSFVVAIAAQYPSYSVGLGNLRALAGKPCNLSESVLVERDPNADMLAPVAPVENPLGAVESSGFSPNGIPADVTYRHDNLNGLVGHAQVAPAVNPPGTGGGVLDAPGVNGSLAALPFGLDPATTPVLGSFNPGDPEAFADATSTWYALPPRSDDRPVLTLAAAGEVKRENLGVEFGRRVGGGTGGAAGAAEYEVLGDHELYDIGPAPSWRDMRVPFSEIPDDADVVRIVAHDDEEDVDDWIAFTPPRVPHLTTMQEVLGSEQPVFMDWPVPLITTCQHLPDYLDGVAEVPGYRIRAESGLAVVATNWQSAQGGGPLGRIRLLQRAVTLPTYLEEDWKRQWGDLVRYDPRVPDAAPAHLDTGTATRSGMWTPGPIKALWTE